MVDLFRLRKIEIDLQIEHLKRLFESPDPMKAYQESKTEINVLAW